MCIRDSLFGETGSETFILSYDSQRRIISMIDSISPDIMRSVWTYATNSYRMMVYEGGQHSLTEDYLLNSSQKIDSIYKINHLMPVDTTSEKYTYNAQNRLASIKKYSITEGIALLAETITYTYDANGNPLTEVSSLGETYTHEYGTAPNTIDMGMVGEQAVPNLKTKTTYNDGSGNTTVSLFTYVYDSNNRIIEMKETIAGEGSITYAYTYN